MNLNNKWIMSFDLAVESRSITVYISGKKFGDDMDQQMTFPVQCSFWSFVDMDSSSRRNIQKTNTLIGQMVKYMCILLLECCSGNLVTDFNLNVFIVLNVLLLFLCLISILNWARTK